jgi:hypothetical protein
VAWLSSLGAEAPSLDPTRPLGIAHLWNRRGLVAPQVGDRKAEIFRPVTSRVDNWCPLCRDGVPRTTEEDR